MTAVASDRFPEFFEAVRGHEPFLWQADLAERLIDSRFPGLIDVPTGLGKTSVIDCWAYALGVHAFRDPRGVPLRLSFVVDRRLVVDAAYDDAMALADVLTKAADGSGVVGDIARALRSLHGGEEKALEVVRMRGGATWESRWLARPDQAAVIVGTVDQWGSRLLFRGYGVSAPMRPINAALVGVDSWLVVDEAHIAEPLIRTVERVRAHQRLQDLTSGRGLRFTLMSATIDRDGDALRADPEEQATSTRFPSAAREAAKRLHVSKPVAVFDLTYLTSGAGKAWRDTARRLGEALATIARRAMTMQRSSRSWRTQSRPLERRIDISSRGTRTPSSSSAGFAASSEIGSWSSGFEGPGRGRPGLGGAAVRGRDPTVEVGANLDFDALVTECAPLSSLVQRFGRVNRTGDRLVCRSAVVHAGLIHDADPIYGDATSSTWEVLRDRGGVAAVDKEGLEQAWPAAALDFGLRFVPDLMRDAPAEVQPRAPFVPVALGAHMERWAATNATPFPDQVVAPFLHGVDRDIPEVSIAWRAAPPGMPGTEERWREWLDLVPPVEWEFVGVPLWQAKAFLAGKESELPTSDLEGALEAQDTMTYPASGAELLGVTYTGRNNDVSPIRGAADVGPGDRVILRSDLGGHDAWGWTGRRSGPGDALVPDVGDLAPTRRRGVLRLSRAVFDTWTPADEVVAQAFANLDPGESDTVALTLRLLSEAGLPTPLDRLIEKAGRWPMYLAESAAGGLPVVFLTAPPSMGRGQDTASDDDEASTSQTATQVSLAGHGEHVGTTARAFAEHLGLPREVARAVELAGRWHDLGKADDRFQLMLHDGDQLSALAAAEPLAKSGRDSRDPVARRARGLAGLPSGFRHEAVSARLFDELTAAHPSLVEAADAELVRHLIVSHHGADRSLLPPLLDPAAPKIRVEVDAVEVIADGASTQVDWAHRHGLRR